MVTCAMFEKIEVSPEMTALLGTGDASDAVLPDLPSSVLIFAPGDADRPASVRIIADAHDAELGCAEEGPSSVTFVVTRAALERLFGWNADADDGARYHLTSDQRVILLAIGRCELQGAARTPYLLAKSIELLCTTAQPLADGSLLPLGRDCALSTEDTARVVAARRMIDEQWSHKLTLDMIARACGLNRAKLTRGFRDVFDCSVADAIAQRRLGEAQQMLAATDLPVATIGYKCGYLNNASFARAFSRQFGVAPTRYRAHRFAA